MTGKRLIDWKKLSFCKASVPSLLPDVAGEAYIYISKCAYREITIDTDIPDIGDEGILPDCCEENCPIWAGLETLGVDDE